MQETIEQAENPFRRLHFKGTWREYQARVLEELEEHLIDDKLHIVAAPGSGKTVLGLEVVRRLESPTLILTPTITIRNQWILRLKELFTPDALAHEDNWISHDIYNLKFLTVVTYQALLSALKKEPVVDSDPLEFESDEVQTEKPPEITESQVLATFKKAKIDVIVLDEAHHLRNEWWKSLIKLRNALKQPKIVSLTATPPYDVDNMEWKRYHDLCGPIDSEISVPELVTHKDLCPHQDFIHFSLPNESERTQSENIKSDIRHFLEKVKNNEDLIQVLTHLPWFQDPSAHVDVILKDPSFFSSILIYLNTSGVKIPRQAASILGGTVKSLPPLNEKWLEILFQGLIYQFRDLFPEEAPIIKDLEKDLKRTGLIDRRRVSLSEVKEIKRGLINSVGKLNSILDIAQLESQKLEKNLRMVILTDYIRKADLPKKGSDLKSLNQLGVVPIFEQLRRAQLNHISLGVLTGSLVFIPKSCKATFIKVAQDHGLPESAITLGELAFDNNYLNVDIKEKNKHTIVQIVTDVFKTGEINTLVGTQALLGEGWDSPSLNTLILASSVGSFMLSNQMRGRAIRKNSDAPNKVSNIWHLVTLDLYSIETILKELFWNNRVPDVQADHFDLLDNLHILGNDMRVIQKRFNAFEGLSYRFPPTIESGIQRLQINIKKWTPRKVKAQNRLMLDLASDRDLIRSQWEKALKGHSPKPEMREKALTNKSPRGITLSYSIQALIFHGLVLASTVAAYIIHYVRYIEIALVCGVIVSLPKFVKALLLFLRNGSVEGSLKQLGHAVLETLCQIDAIKTNYKQLNVKAAVDSSGVMYVHLQGGTHYERSIFIDAMTEILSPIENPRYVLIRKSTLSLFKRVDFHAVPTRMGAKKEHATLFAKLFSRYVCPSDLVYTRTPKGRKTLLKARMRALTATFRKKSERISIWE